MAKTKKPAPCQCCKRLAVRLKKVEHYVGVLLRARRKTFYVSGDN